MRLCYCCVFSMHSNDVVSLDETTCLLYPRLLHLQRNRLKKKLSPLVSEYSADYSFILSSQRGKTLNSLRLTPQRSCCLLDKIRVKPNGVKAALLDHLHVSFPLVPSRLDTVLSTVHRAQPRRVEFCFNLNRSSYLK